MSVILLTYANSEEDRLLHLREEDDRIDQLLSDGKRARHFLLEREQYATPEKITAKLHSFRDEIEFFGYSGHVGQGELVTEGSEARAEGIAHLLGLCPNLKVVMLNGCATAGQVDALLEKGVPAVIATYAPVGDELAKDFAVELFRALKDGDSLETAFSHAEGAIRVKKDVRFRQQSRGLGPAVLSDQDWGLFWREDKADVLQWKLPAEPPPNLVLKDTPQAPEAAKIFFVVDKANRERYYQKIRNSFSGEGRFIFNDILGIGDTIREEALLQEAAAADIVVMLVNGLDFLTLWNALPKLKQYLAETTKPYILIKLPGSKEPLETIARDIGRPEDAKLPGFLIQLDSLKDQPGILEDYLTSNFRIELRQAFQQTLQKNSIPAEKLKPELLEFDLDTPTRAFRQFLEDSGFFHFVVLQGTMRCGQDLLLERLLGYLPALGNCEPYRIDFKSGAVPVNMESHLWQEVSRYLIGSAMEQPEIVAAVLAAQLKQRNLLFIFDNVATDEAGAGNLDMVISFCNYIQSYLSGMEQDNPHQLFLFVINRGAHCGVCFQPGDFKPPNSILLQIEPINRQTLEDWLLEKRRRFANVPLFDKLMEDQEELLGDGHLSDVIYRICDRLNCKTLYP